MRSTISPFLAPWLVRPNWVLADQAVVSGSKFASGVLVARFLGPEMFGGFVLMQIAQIYASGCQSALVISPMLVGAPRLEGAEREHYLSGMFALQIMLSLVLSMSLVILACAWRLLSPHANPELTGAPGLTALIAAMVTFQFQDWQRRCFFATGRSRGAFLIDVVNYLSLLLLLGGVGLGGFLSVSLVFWIMALSSFASFLAGHAVNRVRPAYRHGLDALRREMKACCDYLLSWQIMWVGTQGAFLIGTGLLGHEAIGGIRATQNMMGPFNALLQALDNVIPVNAANRYRKAGIAAVVAYLRSVTVRGTVMLVPSIAVIVMLGEPLTRMLYGERYLAFASLIGWQGVYILSQFYVTQLYYFFRVVSATRSIFISCCVVAVVATSMTFFCAQHYRATGVVVALVCGTLAGLACALLLAATRFKQRESTRLLSASATEPT
jgi:O-antigen/teichoic acid export membrane protein